MQISRRHKPIRIGKDWKTFLKEYDDEIREINDCNGKTLNVYFRPSVDVLGYTLIIVNGEVIYFTYYTKYKYVKYESKEFAENNYEDYLGKYN